MAELMEDRGIKTFFCALAEGMDGMTADVRREGLPDAHVIVIDQDVSRDRQRFTIAHEIGHMILDVSPGMDRELAVHRFAGAFLMPEEALWASIGRHRSNIDWRELLGLKLAFGMSIQAITHRCRALGIISEALRKRLFDTFEQVGWRSPPYMEPLDMAGSRLGRFERLCFRALAEGAISESKAAELLDVPVGDLDHRWVPIAQGVSQRDRARSGRRVGHEDLILDIVWMNSEGEGIGSRDREHSVDIRGVTATLVDVVVADTLVELVLSYDVEEAEAVHGAPFSDGVDDIIQMEVAALGDTFADGTLHAVASAASYVLDGKCIRTTKIKAL